MAAMLPRPRPLTACTDGNSMSLRRTLLSATVAVALLSACSLRPRYREVVVPEATAQQKPADGQLVVLRVVDSTTGQPVPGAKVLSAGGRARLVATSDSQGLLTVTVSQALLDENPLVEVVLPKGVHGYRLEPVPRQPAAPADTNASGEPSPGSEAVAPEAPAETAADGGTNADAGM